jgi:hypothetical protein
MYISNTNMGYEQYLDSYNIYCRMGHPGKTAEDGKK